MVQKRNRSGRRREVTSSNAHNATANTSANVEMFNQMVSKLLHLWGSNAFGQLGMGAEVMERVRPAVSDLTKKIVDVACGAMHTVVILEDGTIWTSGVNDDGALGRETAEETSNGGAVPTDKDPTVFGRVHLPGGAARPVQSVATDSASFVLTEDGCVFGWGTFRNERGIFRFSPTANRQLTPALVYKPRGNDAPPVVKLAAGSNHVVAILKNGGAMSWGDGDQGQLGRISVRNTRRRKIIKKNMLRPTLIPGCRHIVFEDAFCGEYSTFLRASSGQFFAFGLNNSGQLGIPLASGISNEDTLTLEGRVENLVTLLKPTEVKALSDLNILKVAAGKDHGIGMNEAGCVYSWGVPTYGVLGRKELEDRVTESTPFPISEKISALEDSKIIDIASGQVVSGAIDENGDLYTWGAAVNEMLGYAAEDDVLAPKKVRKTGTMKDKKFTKVFFGGQHSAMLSD